MKISLKNVQNTDFSRCFKIEFGHFFKLHFYVSFNIFISTCRMIIIFLPTYSLILGECFRYLQRVLEMIFDDSCALWSENLLQKCKNGRIFEMVQNRFWRLFLAPFLRFLQYFHFYVSYDHNFFTYVFLDVRRVF